MLIALGEAMSDLPELTKDASRWDSLVINRRKPHTYRIFTQLANGLRLSLHRFSPCDADEAFFHPHPWPGAFCVLQGRYRMEVGRSKDRTVSPDHAITVVLEPFSRYEIISPLTWHTVVPAVETYTVMVNGPPWPAEVAHINVRTTRGKDLGKMADSEVLDELLRFRTFARDYLELLQEPAC